MQFTTLKMVCHFNVRKDLFEGKLVFNTFAIDKAKECLYQIMVSRVRNDNIFIQFVSHLTRHSSQLSLHSSVPLHSHFTIYVLCYMIKKECVRHHSILDARTHTHTHPFEQLHIQLLIYTYTQTRTHARNIHLHLVTLHSSDMKCIVRPCTNTYARSTHSIRCEEHMK